MPDADRYFLRFAAAFVRGRTLQGDVIALPEAWSEVPLEDLSDEQCGEIFQIGLQHGLKLHKFKRSMELLRVQRVLGVLRAVAPTELCDIGSGRGVFLWPMLEAFPYLPVTACDHSEQRARDLQAVRLGGIERFDPHQADATRLEFDDRRFDVVSLLEVLEHIPECQQALSEVVRIAARFVVLSVPSKEDDNPEHIHLFDETRLRAMFSECGVDRVRFDYVPGHIVAVANIEGRR